MIYLDNNATTRPSDEVVRAAREGLESLWHNPSSVHRPGQRARQAVELARRDLARLIGARPRDLTLCSSGTESIDLAIRGTLALAKAPVLVTNDAEHAAVRDLAEALERDEGVEVRRIPLRPGGLVDLDALPGLLDGATMASVLWANNETGAVQPVREIGELCRERGVRFHCDATQWVGKMPTDLGAADAPPVDLLSFSPHKFHGPKGVGVLYARRAVRLRPITPGAQELGRRGGTENVPGILGAGAAAREALTWLGDAGERKRLAGLRDRLERAVLDRVPGAVVNAPADRSLRLWNTTNIGFPRLEAEALLLLLSEQGLCASAGAACSSGSLDPSPVLLAMGIPPEVAHGSIRFSLSRETTEAEIGEAAGIIAGCVERLSRSLSPLA